MPVTVVVGGQFGSEGKGKVAYEFAKRQNASVAVRVGGSNSGHTVIDPSGKRWAFRHLPTACILPNVVSIIAAGSYIDPDVLIGEIESLHLTPGRLIIDSHAVLISDQDKELEGSLGLRGSIGSTGSGTGAAVINRIRRNGASIEMAPDHPILSRYVDDTRSLMRMRLNAGERIIVEGTQGFGLSVLHSDHYPYVTSRDTSASNFVAEAGLSPIDVDDVVMVLRAFPIRVAGKSGHLPNEIDWETIARESGSPTPIFERTTVTGNVRRVARFDAKIVVQAIEVNAPTKIVLNHVDYFDHRLREIHEFSKFSLAQIRQIERSIDRKMDYLGVSETQLITCNEMSLTDC